MKTPFLSKSFVPFLHDALSPCKALDMGPRPKLDVWAKRGELVHNVIPAGSGFRVHSPCLAWLSPDGAVVLLNSMYPHYTDLLATSDDQPKKRDLNQRDGICVRCGFYHICGVVG